MTPNSAGTRQARIPGAASSDARSKASTASMPSTARRRRATTAVVASTRAPPISAHRRASPRALAASVLWDRKLSRRAAGMPPRYSATATDMPAAKSVSAGSNDATHTPDRRAGVEAFWLVGGSMEMEVLDTIGTRRRPGRELRRAPVLSGDAKEDRFAPPAPQLRPPPGAPSGPGTRSRGAETAPGGVRGFVRPPRMI